MLAKKNFLSTFVGSISMIFILYFFLMYLPKTKCNVTFKNHTTNQISNLKITYGDEFTDIDIPTIDTDSDVDLSLNYNKMNSNDDISIYYYDNAGNKRFEELLLSNEKKHFRNIYVNILTIDDAGLIMLEVDKK